MVEWRRFEGGDKPDATGVLLTPHIRRALMRNSEPREGHSERVPAVPPALEPVVSRRSLAVRRPELAQAAVDLPAFINIQRNFYATVG